MSIVNCFGEKKMSIINFTWSKVSTAVLQLRADICLELAAPMEPSPKGHNHHVIRHLTVHDSQITKPGRHQNHKLLASKSA